MYVRMYVRMYAHVCMYVCMYLGMQVSRYICMQTGRLMDGCIGFLLTQTSNAMCKNLRLHVAFPHLR